MSGDSNCTVYVGNVDERVSERVLYDILIQAGKVIDLHIPRDKDTDKPKGFAFAEYESDEIADYAVKLFSGLVSLHNRTLKFAISGQDKLSGLGSGHRARPQSLSFEHSDRAQAHGQGHHYASERLFSPLSPTLPLDYTQEPPPPGVSTHSNGASLEYSRRVMGSILDNHSRPRRY